MPSPQRIKKLGSRRAFLRAAGPRLSAARLCTALSCKKTCHCEGAKRPWQSASLVPMAPLPKGGWHGKAVTGGFFFPTAPAGHAGPALQSAALSGRADRAVHPYKPFRRGRCLHRPAHRITNNASVGAGVPDGPPSPAARLSAGRGALTLPPGPWATPWRYFGDFWRKDL